jgi:hypothetical protein
MVLKEFHHTNNLVFLSPKLKVCPKMNEKIFIIFVLSLKLVYTATACFHQRVSEIGKKLTGPTISET